MRHRGNLLIHAARKWDKTLAAMCQDEPFKSTLAAMGITWGIGGKLWVPSLPFGAIVGKVMVVGCFKTGIVHETLGPVISDKERAFGDYSPGRFAIDCREPHRFESPVPYIGHQGLFDVDAPEIQE